MRVRSILVFRAWHVRRHSGLEGEVFAGQPDNTLAVLAGRAAGGSNVAGDLMMRTLTATGWGRRALRQVLTGTSAGTRSAALGIWTNSATGAACVRYRPDDCSPIGGLGPTPTGLALRLPTMESQDPTWRCFRTLLAWYRSGRDSSRVVRDARTLGKLSFARGSVPTRAVPVDVRVRRPARQRVPPSRRHFIWRRRSARDLRPGVSPSSVTNRDTVRDMRCSRAGIVNEAVRERAPPSPRSLQKLWRSLARRARQARNRCQLCADSDLRRWSRRFRPASPISSQLPHEVSRLDGTSRAPEDSLTSPLASLS